MPFLQVFSTKKSGYRKQLKFATINSTTNSKMSKKQAYYSNFKIMIEKTRNGPKMSANNNHSDKRYLNLQKNDFLVGVVVTSAECA